MYKFSLNNVSSKPRRFDKLDGASESPCRSPESGLSSKLFKFLFFLARESKGSMKVDKLP